MRYLVCVTKGDVVKEITLNEMLDVVEWLAKEDGGVVRIFKIQIVREVSLDEVIEWDGVEDEDIV